MTETRDDQKKQDKKNGNEKNVNEKDVVVDFGMGKISFGGLFQGIGNVIDLVSRLEEEGRGQGRREEEFTSPSGRVKAVYGFSVKTSVGGMPTIESFGNVRETSKGPVVEEERQPLVDVFDEEDHILIIAELPGVEEERISAEINGDILTLSAASGDRKYYKEVVLPKNADTASLQRKYRNGVLELRMSKK